MASANASFGGQTGSASTDNPAVNTFNPNDPNWQKSSASGVGFNTGQTIWVNGQTGQTVITDQNNVPVPGQTAGPAGSHSILDVTKTVVGDNGVAGALGLNNVIPNGALTPISGLTSDATANIQAAIAQQNGLVQQNGQALANFNPYAAPTASAPGAISAAMAGQQAPIQAALAQAQNSQAAQIGQTALTPQQQAIIAQQIAAAQLGPAAQAQTAQIAPTNIGPTSLTSAASLDPTQQAQARAAQMGLVSSLQNTISGQTPSVAEIMLRQATDRNIANQYALAQAATGMNTGLAQRTAMINAADMNQTAIGQQALARAQEIQAAQGQLAGVLGQTRGTDVDVAAQQAQLAQQANLANQGATNTSTLTQAQINAAAAQQQAQLATQTGQFNVGQQNAQALNQAQLGQAAQIANQQASLQAGTTNTTLAQQAALANAGAQNTTFQQNANLQQGANLQNAQLGTQASLANASNQTNANTSSAQLANAVNLANANNQSQANTTQAQLSTQAQIANANNNVSTNALNQKAQQDLAGNQLTAAGQAGQTSVGYGNTQAEIAKAQAAQNASLIGAAGSAAAKLLS